MNILSEQTLSTITDWAITHGFKIIGIIIGAIIIKRIAGHFIASGVRRAIKVSRFSSEESELKRENTIVAILSGSLMVILWTIASIMVLSELGIDVAPMLAAAGIAGIALGFGGQYLIKDIISGFFIIIENQFRVGDVACIDGKCGLVEEITLRMTTLRDLDGVVHHIPNGSATVISNMTKEMSRVNLNIGISYNTELDKAIKVINKVGEDMAKDKDWSDDIIEAPQFLRVDDFADSSVVIKILGETKPARQWDVTGELRKRLKIAFDKNGIEIPFPQRVMHEAAKPAPSSTK